VQQRVGLGVETPMADGPLPLGGAGDRGVEGHLDRGPALVSEGDTLFHFFDVLSRQAHHDVGSDVRRFEPGRSQSDHCTLKALVGDFAPTATLLFWIAALQPQPHGLEPSLKYLCRQTLVYQFGVQAVRGVEAAVKPAGYDLVQDDVDVLLGVDQQGVVVEGKVAHAQLGAVS